MVVMIKLTLSNSIPMIRIYLYYNVLFARFKIMPMTAIIRGVEFPKYFEHMIIDSGVNEFFKYKQLKDYPRWYLEVYPKLAVKLQRKYGDKVWIVIPDYPDDYRHNRIENNMEKTLSNIVKFLEKYPDVNWLVSIQAKFSDALAFREACRIYRETIGDYPRVAVGTLCTTATEDYAKACCMYARQYFPKSWIHVFGPNVKWLRFMQFYVNSIDTVAYYKPPMKIRGKGVTDRDEYARAWIETAKKYCQSLEF